MNEKIDINKLLKYAEEGDVESMVEIARCYMTGDDVEEDHEKAKEWLEKAAEKKCVRAVAYLAVIGLNNADYGVKSEGKKTEEWINVLKEYAEDDALASLFAGYYYYFQKDYKNEAKWIKKAAEAGNAEAMYRMGWMVTTGTGFSRNVVKGAKLIQKAAEYGCVEA